MAVCNQLANPKRVQMWVAKHGPIPAGMRVGSTCHIAYCGRLEHMELVENLNADKKSFRQYVTPLEQLAPGGILGIAVPFDKEPKEFQRWVSGRLHGFKELWMFRWLTRLSPDGKRVIVRKHGTHGSFDSEGQKFEQPKLCSICGKKHGKKMRRRCLTCGKWFHNRLKSSRSKFCSIKCRVDSRKIIAAQKIADFEMPLCACGCGKRVKTFRRRGRGSNVDLQPVKFCMGHRMSKMGKCLACGKEFKLKQRKYCCSKKCSYQIGYGWKTVEKKPWEVSPKEWKRIKCEVCGRFKWRPKSKWKYKVCSMSCRQKRTAKKYLHRVPRDRDILYDLVVVKQMCCADINRFFGVHENSGASRRAIKAVGLEPVVVPRWRSRTLGTVPSRSKVHRESVRDATVLREAMPSPSPLLRLADLDDRGPA